MKNEKLDELIDQTDRFARNLGRFYKGNLLIDKDVNPKKTAKTEITKTRPGEEEVKKAILVAHKQTKDTGVVVEMDIFGNETMKREEWEFAESLDQLNSLIHDCRKCELWKTRTNFVFGVGNPNADIVVIGEAPGADEDAQGEPFVGRAGQLLNKILDATGFAREEVFICNILKSRPPGNRNPMPVEVEACRPYLEKQLKLVNPKLILLLGRVAAESLLKTKEPLAKLRGKIHNYKGWNVMVTFHPAALLRNPNWKRPTWEDMLQFKALYEEMTGKKVQSKGMQ